MNIEGIVTYINNETQLAAADIGWGKAVVFEFPADAPLDIGDQLEYLSNCYGRCCCINAAKKMEMNILQLADSLPLHTAKFIVENDIVENGLSRVA